MNTELKEMNWLDIGPTTVIEGNQWLWSDVWVPWVSANSELKKVDELDTSSQNSDTVGTSDVWVPWVSVNSELKEVDESDTSSQDSDTEEQMVE